MACIAQQADIALLDVWVGIMYPQPPRLYFNTDRQMRLNLRVQFGVWSEQFLDWSVLSSPRLCSVVAPLTGEETIVR